MPDNIQLTFGFDPMERFSSENAALTPEQYGRRMHQIKLTKDQLTEHYLARYRSNPRELQYNFDNYMRTHPVAVHQKKKFKDFIDFIKWYRTRDYETIVPLTNKHMTKLRVNGLAKNRDKDHFPVVKLFSLTSPDVWLLTHVDPKARSRAFGLYNGGYTPWPRMEEVDLKDITQLKPDQLFKIEHDPYFKPRYTISVYERAAKELLEITEKESVLRKFIAPT